MKSKLLKKVRCRAIYCAHINSFTTTSDINGTLITGASIGFGIAENEPYRGVWSFNMDGETFDRKIRQIYWSLNKEKYYAKYRKDKKDKKK